LSIVAIYIALTFVLPAEARITQPDDADVDASDEQETAGPTQDVEVHAKHAREAAEVAKQAAVVANKVATHSKKVSGHAKKALKHALGALHDARVDSKGLDKQQKESLKKAEAKLREATKTADHGELKKVKDETDVKKEKMQAKLDKTDGSESEKEKLREEIKELRQKIKEKNLDDKEIEKALDDLEAAVEKSDGSDNDELKAELGRLREQIDKYEAQEEPAPVAQPPPVSEPPVVPAPTSEEEVTPVEEKGIDIDTQMPYGDLEPFGREDTAQELTESSIKESDEMVDQLERAEVAEEKRAVFRALTRLRGAAITSFDGVARSQTGNVDEYNKVHKWRKSHPLHHLADEESDIAKWAFPDNAD